MKAKGTAVKAVSSFVNTRYGSEGYSRWLAALPDESRSIMIRPVSSGAWYPVTDGVFTPQKVLCDLFFQGDHRGAWEQGRFAADQDLRGIYLMFVKVASPEFLIRNVAAIWGSYYTESKAEATVSRERSAELVVTGITPENPYIMNAIGGWVERALEICGCSGISIKGENRNEDGQSVLQYECSWD